MVFTEFVKERRNNLKIEKINLIKSNIMFEIQMTKRKIYRKTEKNTCVGIMVLFWVSCLAFFFSFLCLMQFLLFIAQTVIII